MGFWIRFEGRDDGFFHRLVVELEERRGKIIPRFLV